MEKISKAINDKDYEKSLALIHGYVDDIITESYFTGRIFGSKELDVLCQRIGNATLANLRHLNPIISNGSDIVVYVVTKLNKTGGHTRVIKDFINLLPNCIHHILLTEIAGNSDIEYIENYISSNRNVIYECAPRSGFLDRLNWLQSRLILINPLKVYLFNHHQDSVAVASIQPEMNLDAYFYHHGDHHLCLGIYLTHLKHIDPHPMGYHNCKFKLGIENLYVPLTVADKRHDLFNFKFLLNDKLTTCTAANSNKIEIPYFTSYTKFVPELLKVTGGKHVHIGRLSQWALYKIRRGLALNGIDSSRFIYIKWVPSVWGALIQHKIDLYIASFPYGGGLTLIEAMGAGIPVALHRHKYVDFLSGIELAWPEAFVWRESEELLHYCKNISRDILISSAHSGRLHYEKFYSENHLSSFLKTGNECKSIPAKSYSDISKNIIEHSTMMMNHFSLSHIIYRGLFRLFKKIRNMFF
jgi:hypothetical protein